jgi:probable HAF family extracellular repeat protein
MRREFRTHLLAFSLALGAVSTALGENPTFTMIDFPGATGTQAWGVNPRGDIIGLYTLADKSTHGFLLTGDRFIPIDYPGSAVTLANGINPAGDIVGDFGLTLTGPHRGFLMSADGHFTAIDYPGAAFTSADGINPRGDVVGIYTLADNITRGFLLSAGKFTDIDYPGANSTVINGMNARGDVVGGYTNSGVSHAFLLNNGKYTTIDYPGAAFTTATGVNSGGDIVGRYRDSGGVNHGFLLIGGQFSTLDFPRATYTGATAITPAGDIVGRQISGGVTHGFLLSRHVRHMGHYSITDLGPLPGGNFSYAAHISESGLVAGRSSPADSSQHATLWQLERGQTYDVGMPGLGGLNSEAFGVNESMQASGEASTSDPDPNAEDFCGFQALGLPSKGTTCAAFLWQNGTMTRLPTLGGPNGSGSGLNNRGDVVGYAENNTKDPACGAPQLLQFKPAVWANGTARELPTFPGDLEGSAFGINDNGQIAGSSGNCVAFSVTGQVYLQSLHALLWENGETIDLGNLGGTGLLGGGNSANAVNGLGWVAGNSDLAGDANTTTTHGFLWTRQTGMQDLPPLRGDVVSVALGINDAGQLTGISIDPTFSVLSAVLWQDGDPFNLNSLVIPGADAGLYLQLAESINSRGEIVGFAQTSTGDVHGFLAIPNDADPNSPTVSALAQYATAGRPVSANARTLLLRRLRLGRLGAQLAGPR